MLDAMRAKAAYAYGYLHGRSYALPTSVSGLYGSVVSKVTSFVTVPLPILSVLAVPLYGGSSTTVSLVFFYATWSVLVLNHDPLALEIYGTLTVRLLCFVLPAIAFLAFDCLMPALSLRIKAKAEKQLPNRLSRYQLFVIAGVSIGNEILAVLLQASLELLVTRTMHLRSLLRVTSIVPLPLSLLKDLLKGLVFRGIVHYIVHRWLLHTWQTVLNRWHIAWQHSLDFPFSLVAAYDHPLCYLLSQWLPTILPAYVFRWHVLTWHIFLVLTSLEELVVNSAYSALPSSIVLSGMARRTEAHFNSVQAKKDIGNFGSFGLLDFMLGTTCKESGNLLENVQDEAEKHQFQERVNEAVQAAMASIADRKQGFRGSNVNTSSTNTDTTSEDDTHQHDGQPTYEDAVTAGASRADDQQQGPRRSERRKH